MARRRNTPEAVQVENYKHTGVKRKNIPPAKIAGEGTIPKVKKAAYAYSPHLAPVLHFDPDGRTDRGKAIVEKAVAAQKLTSQEAETLRAIAENVEQPWLEWAGKKEEHARRHLTVDPVALHIHERVSANAVVRAAMRKDVQRSLFADPEQDYAEAIKFYQHDIDWANRLILGDSLQVMSSLSRRENLAGKVQMIYMDPPYGIQFASNFQPEVGKRQVKEQQEDLTREPEMVKAFRDIWHLGVHSYLTYLRDRLIVAKELLANTGSIFVQISDENVHLVRSLLDEVFRPQNFFAEIVFTKTRPLGATGLAGIYDILLWYTRDKKQAKFRPLFEEKTAADNPNYALVEEPSGHRRRLTTEERQGVGGSGSLGGVFQSEKLASSGFTTTCFYDVEFEGKKYQPKRTSWRTNTAGMARLIKADRLYAAGENIGFVSFLKGNPIQTLPNLWADTRGEMQAHYVVQTATRVIERCILMATDPGDLVLDPTCGGGTSAYVAEQWGRRWITIDTSRVAVAIARQRLVTARFEYYRIRDEHRGMAGGFIYKTVPHVTLGNIAQNTNLDPIFAKHEPILDEKLAACNSALRHVPPDLRNALAAMLAAKESREGKRSITNADRRRWHLPTDRFEYWTVPFDTDPHMPQLLQDAVMEYRRAWRAKMDEVNRCIADNAGQEDLVDRPEVVKGVLRVSGPFTVEGVRPEELSLGEDGRIFDPTPNEWQEGDAGSEESQNASAYLDRMIQLLAKDGVTFPNNEHRRFARIEPMYEIDAALHAEGTWEGGDEHGACGVGIAFGPQCGPVTAEQVEDLIRASRRYDELVIAAFSFDGAAQEVIQESANPRLKIHMAHIRPDVSPGMDGLLKETPDSQLFTVFGQPEIDVRPAKGGKEGEIEVELKGVDIYSPLTGEVHSTGASKVAAWFLDSDYDGRCFCITQAFFPDQDSWDKIANALGSAADAEAFEAYKGTISLPFRPSKYQRIAVKVIDPRGNEVMAIRSLREGV